MTRLLSRLLTRLLPRLLTRLLTRQLTSWDTRGLSTTTPGTIGSGSGVVLGMVPWRGAWHLEKLVILKQKPASVNYAKLNFHKTTRVALYQREDSISVSSVVTLGSQCHLGTGVDFKAATGSLYMLP